MSERWTSADAAELNVLTLELVNSCFDHREGCEACKHRGCRQHGRKVCAACSVGCPDVLAYFDHRADCWKCHNSIKVATDYYGAPCPRYGQHIEHGNTCKRCNPCPALLKAIDLVIVWRDRRALLSRAEGFRAAQTVINRERAVA